MPETDDTVPATAMRPQSVVRRQSSRTDRTPFTNWKPSADLQLASQPPVLIVPLWISVYRPSPRGSHNSGSRCRRLRSVIAPRAALR